MAVTTFLPLGKVRRRDDARPREEGAVKFLADSMRESGQLMPILVRPVGDEFELIAGSHRLAAAEALDWPEIEARFAEHDDDLHAKLAMIDENLCRSELVGIERDRQIAERKAIYEAIHPETRSHVAGAHASNAAQGNAAAKLAPAFTTETATITGRSERSVQRSAERGEKLCADAVAIIRNTKLDTGTYVDKIKNLPPNDQVQAAKRDLAISNKADRAEKGATATPPAKAPVEPKPQDQFAAWIELTDGTATLTADAIFAACPVRSRPTLSQRCEAVRAIIDRLDDLIERPELLRSAA